MNFQYRRIAGMSKKSVYEAPHVETCFYEAADVVLASFGDNDGQNPWTEGSAFQENGGDFNG